MLLLQKFAILSSVTASTTVYDQWIGCFAQDNDIVLCDGPCNRGYHERCISADFHVANIDEAIGWLCPGCQTKVGA